MTFFWKLELYSYSRMSIQYYVRSDFQEKVPDPPMFLVHIMIYVIPIDA
jgi:hypothetical protein